MYSLFNASQFLNDLDNDLFSNFKRGSYLQCFPLPLGALVLLFKDYTFELALCQKMHDKTFYFCAITQNR